MLQVEEMPYNILDLPETSIILIKESKDIGRRSEP